VVQDDIVEQLGLSGAMRAIHGFRRSNIAIEVVETPRPARAALAHGLLLDPSRRPAIVYTPTRKEAATLARELDGDFRRPPTTRGWNPARATTCRPASWTAGWR